MFYCFVFNPAFPILYYGIILTHLKKLKILSKFGLDLQDDYGYYNKSNIFINKVQ